MTTKLGTLGGLHHVTAMAGDPQRNLNFYTQVLGQRLVKTTVNFDDPGTYHFYYGDAIGTPGTILTFFPWPHARRGRLGAGETSTVAYATPPGSLAPWRTRLEEFGITYAEATRFDAPLLRFNDPDGMTVEIVEGPKPVAIDYWAEGPLPAEMALCGFHSVTLVVSTSTLPSTQALLTDLFGYTQVGEDDDRIRYAGDTARGPYLDLVAVPATTRGTLGAGSIHHIAFRVPDDAAQLAWRHTLTEAGRHVTEVRDRQYFRSIYFREPSGVLFELATDIPGFLWDEDRAQLGTALKLPPWLEPQRDELAAALPPITPVTP